MNTPAQHTDRLQRARTLCEARRYAEAEQLVRESLALSPRHADAWELLGAVLHDLGQLDDAEHAFNQALQLDRSPATLALQARLKFRRGDWPAAEALMTEAASVRPSADASMLLGHAALRRGRRQIAAEHFRTAFELAPHNFDALKEFCYAKFADSLDEVIAMLERHCMKPDIGFAIVPTLWLLVNYKERSERIRHGMTPTNVQTPSEMGFHFTMPEIQLWADNAAEWLGAKPHSLAARHFLALAHLAKGDLAQSSEHFAALRPGRRDIIGMTRLEPGCSALNGQDPAVVAATLLPVRHQVTALPPGTQRILFLGCDIRYARKYAWPLLASLKPHKAEGLAVALHIFDAMPDELAEFQDRLPHLQGLPVAVSFETTGLRGPEDQPTPTEARGYYHVVRLVRFLQFLESAPNAAAWHLDADLLFNRSPGSLFELLAGNDIALWMLPGRIEPENQINACLFGIGPTPIGREFLRRVAHYLLRCVAEQNLSWGIDQLALFAVLADMQRSIGVKIVGLPPTLCDGELNDAATVWGGKIDPDHRDYGRFLAALARFGCDVQNLP